MGAHEQEPASPRFRVSGDVRFGSEADVNLCLDTPLRDRANDARLATQDVQFEPCQSADGG